MNDKIWFVCVTMCLSAVCFVISLMSESHLTKMFIAAAIVSLKCSCSYIFRLSLFLEQSWVFLLTICSTFPGQCSYQTYVSPEVTWGSCLALPPVNITQSHFRCFGQLRMSCGTCLRSQRWSTQWHEGTITNFLSLVIVIQFSSHSVSPYTSMRIHLQSKLPAVI